MMRWDGGGAEVQSVQVTVPSAAALLDLMAENLQAGQGFSVATLNLDHVVKLHQDAAFAAAYRAQSFVSADGNPIVWLSRMAGQKEVELVQGSTMIEPMMALAAEHSVPVGFFGSTGASLNAASEALLRKYPGLRVAMSRSPAMGFDPEGEEAQRAVDQIAQSGARLIFLALGAPKQERFAAFAQKQLPHVGFVSIGAGLDFVSGRQTRAPQWVQAMALEWVWRMLSNPRRLALRYAACALIMPRLTLRAYRLSRRA
jgi:N-acetylglucosaminyldiphosphoundecaprenol N-acetyl-beta-D-mannosaminyltransferase